MVKGVCEGGDSGGEGGEGGGSGDGGGGGGEGGGNGGGGGGGGEDGGGGSNGGDGGGDNGDGGAVGWNCTTNNLVPCVQTVSPSSSSGFLFSMRLILARWKVALPSNADSNESFSSSGMTGAL